MVARARAALLAAIVATAALLCVFASAKEPRVYDYADVLDSEEEEKLEEYLAKLSEETGYDFVFLADTELPYIEDYDAAERAAIAHADDFYDYGGFGDPAKDYSGMIFYLDMSNRIPVITTTGKLIDIITDARLAELFDIVYTYLHKEDFYGAAANMFAQAKKFVDAGMPRGQYRYDAGPGGVDVRIERGLILPAYMRDIKAIDVILAVGVGLAAALGYYGTVKSRYSLKGSTYRYDLLANTEVEITESQDIFLRESVTRTPRNPPPSHHGGGGGSIRSSGTHIGSSGRVHGGGGGGRRF